jgi:hypothetical protein
VTTAVIDKPDRIKIRGAENVIAIGSTAYSPGPPGKWTMYRHAGESANYTNAVLLYVHILDLTTSVSRHGDTYVVPSTEATHLLQATRLAYLQHPTGVSWSATVRGGALLSMTLRYRREPEPIAGICGTGSCTLPASPVTVTVTISGVRTSPTIDTPARNTIVS